MAEPFVGQIALFGFNFAPRGWALCSGQLLAIAQNTALFSILGTTYGGNGQTNFALPNLNGRVMAGFGDGPGLTSRALGETGGLDSVTLIPAEIAAHNHSISLSAGAASPHAVPAAGDVLVDPGLNAFLPSATSPLSTNLHPVSVAAAGGGQPHNNDQPVLALNWCIALQGIYPARN